MIRRLLSDRRGVSVTEFAIVLPFMVLLYIGGYQLSDASAAQRKVTVASRTVADLASQYITVTNSDLDTILNASIQVLAPYNINNAKITVSQVYTDNSGNTTVSWSRGKNVSGLTPGTSFNLSSSVKQNNSYLIIASIDYTYTPIVASNLIGTIPMHNVIIMGPRASDQVTFTS